MSEPLRRPPEDYENRRPAVLDREAEVEEPPEEKRALLQPRPRTGRVLLLLALAAIAASVVAWRYYSVRESTDDAQIDGHIVPISSRVTGVVQAVNVNDNQFVEKGALLVQLDPTDYRVALVRAQAELADMQAAAAAAQHGVPIITTNTNSQLSTTAAGLAAARQQEDAAAAELRQAEADYTRVAADLKRYQQLVTRDEISRQQYDLAVAHESAARAAVDAARAQVAAAHSRVAEAQSAVDAAQTAPHQVEVTRARASAATAQAERAQAAVQQAQLNLEYTTLRAPEAGIVSRKSVEPGQVLQSGQPLMALVPTRDLWVTANFKETQLRNMRVGDPVSVHVDAYARDYPGHVDSVGGATGARFSLLPPENATGNYVKVVQRVPVKIVFEPGQDLSLLRPGMSVVPTVKVH